MDRAWWAARDLADPGIDIAGYDVPPEIVVATVGIALVAVLLIVWLARRRRSAKAQTQGGAPRHMGSKR